MPRGEHPNSRKALEEHRKKTQFSGESAVRNAKKSQEAQAVRKGLNADLKERCTPERLAKMNERIMAMAEKGNLRAYELIRDGLGEKPSDKIELKTADDKTIERMKEDFNADL